MRGETAIDFSFDLGSHWQIIATLIEHALPKPFDESEALLCAESKDGVPCGFHDESLPSRHGLSPKLVGCGC
jgi:hypothetical protein